MDFSERSNGNRLLAKEKGEEAEEEESVRFSSVGRVVELGGVSDA